MSTSNPQPKAPATRRRRPGVIIAMIPAGALLGFLGGLLIEIIVGLIARAVFSADHPAAFSWGFLGSLPGLGALIGAIVAPILYARGRAQDSAT
jgi:hypothetical protein